ncbi:hypothetical protein BH20ACT20_BH20ACT20_11540 [soil metagenome]
MPKYGLTDAMRETRPAAAGGSSDALEGHRIERPLQVMSAEARRCA